MVATSENIEGKLRRDHHLEEVSTTMSTLSCYKRSTQPISGRPVYGGRTPPTSPVIHDYHRLRQTCSWKFSRVRTVPTSAGPAELKLPVLLGSDPTSMCTKVHSLPETSKCYLNLSLPQQDINTQITQNFTRNGQYAMCYNSIFFFYITFVV